MKIKKEKREKEGRKVKGRKTNTPSTLTSTYLFLHWVFVPILPCALACSHVYCLYLTIWPADFLRQEQSSYLFNVVHNAWQCPILSEPRPVDKTGRPIMTQGAQQGLARNLWWASTSDGGWAMDNTLLSCVLWEHMFSCVLCVLWLPSRFL